MSAESQENTCRICDKSFGRLASLQKHTRNVHGLVPEYKSAGKRCPTCKERCQRRQDLRTHVETKHGVKQEQQSLSFDTEQEFMAWKAEEEDAKCCYFKKESGQTTGVRDVTYCYYVCNRDGCFVSQATQRQEKKKGTLKMQANCTAGIVIEYHATGGLKVRYNSTHYGHEMKAEYIRIPESQRKMLLEELKQHKPHNVILEEVRSRAQEAKHLSRVHLATAKDLRNISASAGIRRKKKLQKYKVVRSKKSYRLVKQPDNKPPPLPSIKDIESRHKISSNIPKESIKKTSKKKWTVRSQSCDRYYTVENTSFSCILEECKETRDVFRICVHMYSCNCIDSLLVTGLCKHIHAVVRETGLPKDPEKTAPLDHPASDLDPTMADHEAMQSTDEEMSECSDDGNMSECSDDGKISECCVREEVVESPSSKDLKIAACISVLNSLLASANSTFQHFSESDVTSILGDLTAIQARVEKLETIHSPPASETVEQKNPTSKTPSEPTGAKASFFTSQSGVQRGPFPEIQID